MSRRKKNDDAVVGESEAAVATVADEGPTGEAETPAELTAEPAEEKTPRQEAVAEINSRLFAQRKILIGVEGEWILKHHEAGILKKRLEKEQGTLNRLVDELDAATNGAFTPSLPFGDSESSADAKATSDESWRQTELSDLGITGKLAESLQEAGLSTLGAIADWSEAGKLLTDIAGIGPGKAEKIDEACAEYWRTNPRTTGSPSEPENVATDAAESVEHDSQKDFTAEVGQAFVDAGLMSP